MAYQPGHMKLLARGGQADIYEVDEHKVLRMLRNANDEKALKAEQAIMALLSDRGVGVPAVYEYVTVNGLPGLVMQRLKGPSLLQLMMQKPLGAASFARDFARLHHDVLKQPAVVGLMEIKDRVNYLIDQSPLLDEQDRRFVRSQLAELPAGDRLMHGDFHPGNILTEGGKHYIIDWFGAAKGHYVSDIAHTYALLADKPRIPGENALTHWFVRAFARRFAGRYLREIRRSTGFSMEEFGRWLAVRAAERTVYGQPSSRVCEGLRGDAAKRDITFSVA